jgi:nitroimidazol reductase NimA-like FMN-containing flavoprotein (pyridoxamine 5'-phosphate oxidase superfamily)
VAGASRALAAHLRAGREENVNHPDETRTRPAAPRQLNAEECRALIERNYLAVVATVGNGEPYATPLIYGFQEDRFFFVTAEGRKTRNIETQPLVCITIVETEEHARKWRSVLAFGAVSWLHNEEDVDHALAVMKRQYPGASARSSGGAASLARAGFRMGQVVAREISGRAQGY